MGSSVMASPFAGVDVRSFCQTYMADGVPFFVDFHTAKGDEQVQLSPWRNHHNMGRVRELQFVTQLKVRPPAPARLAGNVAGCCHSM